MCFRTAVSEAASWAGSGARALGHFRPPAGQGGLRARWGGASPGKDGHLRPLGGAGRTRNVRLSAGLRLLAKKRSRGAVGPPPEGRGSLDQACGNLRSPFYPQDTRGIMVSSRRLCQEGVVPAASAGVVHRQRRRPEVVEDPYFAGDEVPPSVLKAVPCPELWPPAPLRAQHR